MKIPVLLMARELHIGGSERQMTETARSLDANEFEPHVGCFRPAGIRGDELRKLGIPVRQFPVYSFQSAAAVTEARALAHYVREHGIRIVHTWDYPLNAWALPVTRTLTKAIAVGSQRSNRSLIPPMYRRLVRLSDRFAHAIVVNCEYLRRHLIEEERVPGSKVRVCYNGIDLGYFRRQPVAPHPLTVGVVCGLRPEKDLKTLIRAFAAARKNAPAVRLEIVGSGSEQAILEQYVREAGVSDAAQFRPATDRVAEALSGIDVFVLPSLSEALSNSLMEAMACGCCCIASNVGGNPELVTDGETGMLFPPGDAPALTRLLVSLIENGEERQRLADNAEASIRERFSTAAAARSMGEIYLSLV